MRRFQTFLRLPWPDQLLLIQSMIVLIMVVLGLRVFPWSTLQRLLLKPDIRRAKYTSESRPSAMQIARTIRTASRFIPKASCLPQALAAQMMLTRRAYPAELQIGVARNEVGQLAAHAWVTSTNGIVIGNIPERDRFVRLSPIERKGIH